MSEGLQSQTQKAAADGQAQSGSRRSAWPNHQGSALEYAPKSVSDVWDGRTICNAAERQWQAVETHEVEGHDWPHPPSATQGAFLRSPARCFTALSKAMLLKHV